MQKHLYCRNQKPWKSIDLVRWLTVLEVSVLLLCNAPEFTNGKLQGFFGTESGSTEDDCSDLCLTPDCMHTASTVLENMDPDVDPCDDFYQYACGGFIDKTILTENVPKLNSLLSGQLKVREQLKSIIQADITSDEPRHSSLPKHLYKICMNKVGIAAEGSEPILKQLKKFGGWPVLLGMSWDEDEFHWTTMSYKFRDAGYHHDQLIASTVMPGFRNNTKYVIYISQAVLGISRKFLLNGKNDPEVQNYYKKMVEAAVKLGADKVPAQKELMKALNFEIQLAKIMVSDEDRRDVTKLYNRMTLESVSKLYPSIPWKEYFNTMLTSPVSVEDNDVVIVVDPKFFARLENLLAETPKRVLADYLIWRVVKSSFNYLSTFSATSNPDDCTQIVINQFPILTSALYVRRYFSEEAKSNAVKMVTDMKNQAINMLSKIDWMDDTTKEKALEKTRAMVTHVGYPDELLDDNKLKEYYKNLDIYAGHSYLESVLSIMRFKEDLLWSKLHQIANKSEWTSHADSSTVDAYTSYNQNAFEIPAGILQGFFFNINRPNYMNYGAIGYAIGHEITHNFDDIGKRFDKNGNLHDWWVPKTEERFRQRVQCLLEQYGNYTVPEVGLQLNAENSQGENIADNGGIKMAYLAYKNWVARNKPEKKLPGIDRTPEQMFWLSVANVWCAKSTIKSLEHEVILDPHSPERFRIIGALSNMPEFANDYSCPVGSTMNPERKCSVW